jgi:hypothetical protein
VTASAETLDVVGRRSASAIAGLCLVGLSVILLAQTLATSDRPTVAVVYGGIAFAAYALGLLCLTARGEEPGLGLVRWKLGSWTLLWYSFVFGVATVTWSRPQVGVVTEIEVSSVLRALWVVTVGVSAWMVGYGLGPGRGLRRLAARALRALRTRFTDDVRGPATPWLLYAIGVAGRLAAIGVTGRFGYVGDVSSSVTTASGYAGLLSALSLFAPLAVAVAALRVFRERRPGARSTLVILFLTELAFGAAAGGKQSFVIAVLAVAIPFCSARRRLPKAALAVAGLIFLVVVIPFNQAYRGAARSQSATLSPSQAVATAPGILRQTVSGQNLVTVLPNSANYLMQRIRDIDSVAIVVQRTPSQVKFESPFQLIVAPLAGWVPRILWPGKPIVVTGYVFSQKFFGLPSTLYTSTTDTLVGGFYWFGGWIPVLLGMFVVGCLVRLADDVIDIRSDIHGIFLILLFFPPLVRGEYDWESIMSAIPSSLVVWLLAVALTFRPRCEP